MSSTVGVVAVVKDARFRLAGVVTGKRLCLVIGVNESLSVNTSK
jgi:hypothetical protein